MEVTASISPPPLLSPLFSIPTFLSIPPAPSSLFLSSFSSSPPQPYPTTLYVPSPRAWRSFHPDKMRLWLFTHHTGFPRVWAQKVLPEGSWASVPGTNLCLSFLWPC